MKIAIPVKTNNQNTEIDARFGRANYFMIFDSNTKNYNFIDNSQSVNSGHGAGISAANKIVNNVESIDIIISPALGPKAFDVLKMANIKILKSQNVSIEENINLALNNQLTEMTAPAY